MKNTKMSISTTNAYIKYNQTIREILDRIKSREFKDLIRDLRIIVDIKSKKSSEYKELKESLLGFTPSGIFNKKRSNKSFNIESYSKIFVLDIDDLKDGQHVADIKDVVKKINTTMSVFISPSGLGCKILVKVNSTIVDHNKVYNQLMSLYNDYLLGLNAKCDVRCSDLSRLHYFSYDPNIYINWESVSFEPPIISEEALNELIINLNRNNLPIMNLEQEIQFCENLTQNKIKFTEGRNNYILLLACNLNRHGVKNEDSLNYILSKYEEAGFTEFEIKTTVNGAYNRYIKEFGKFQKKQNTKDDKNPPKSPDYKEIRIKIGLFNSKFVINDYFSLIFQSNENEEDTFILNNLLEGFDDISQVFNDGIYSYFSSTIQKKQFNNSFFSENTDETIRNTFQTLFDNVVNPVDERLRRILIADFKAECLQEYYKFLLKQQPFVSKKGISNSLNELSRIVKLFENQISTSKAFLEDCFDNPLGLQKQSTQSPSQ